MVQCYCSPNPDDVDDDEDVGDGNDGKNYEDDDDSQATLQETTAPPKNRGTNFCGLEINLFSLGQSKVYHIFPFNMFI